MSWASVYASLSNIEIVPDAKPKPKRSGLAMKLALAVMVVFLGSCDGPFERTPTYVPTPPDPNSLNALTARKIDLGEQMEALYTASTIAKTPQEEADLDKRLSDTIRQLDQVEAQISAKTIQEQTNETHEH